MTPEEQFISDCLANVFRYCKKHKDSCEGCIFFKEVNMFGIRFVTCKVIYAPDFLEDSEENLND